MAKAKKLAEGLKRIGDKVVKKRMTAKERKEMSKPFNKMLSDAQKSKKGMSKKEFDARVKKGMAKDARIAKVKAENMAAATGPKKPKKLKDGSGKVGVGARIKDLAGKAVRGAYRKATPQLQVANRIAQFVKPESGIAKAIKSVAQPTLPSGGKKISKAKPTPIKKSTKKVLREFDPKKNNAARRKSSKGKVGKNRESDTSNFESLRPTMATPGEAIAPKARRMPARMKGGGEVMNYKSGGTVSKSKATGAAKRGFGKAYMKGKR